MIEQNQSAIRVFKFGGASLHDAAAIRNAVKILNKYGGGRLILIISAIGKSTNALEKIHETAFVNNLTEAFKRAEELKNNHFKILSDLLSDKSHLVFAELEALFVELNAEIQKTSESLFNQSYDRIVQFGERIATIICAAYFIESGLNIELLDARKFIITDDNFRDAYVDWDLSNERIQTYCNKAFENIENKILLTQGFIAATKDGRSTTLGREGSDFSAAIFAYCTNASDMIIWKDVQGFLSADPKILPEAQFLPHLSYRESVELAYYGATVIHPKTIKPLENKRISLKIRSFLNPELPSTCIDHDMSDDKNISSFIFKYNQVLLSILPRDFSFINENNISEFFSVFSKNNIRVRLMQNSAVSFSLCFDNDNVKLPLLLDELKEKYIIRYNENVELITIRHYNENSAFPFIEGKKVLMEQKSRSTWQIISKLKRLNK